MSVNFASLEIICGRLTRKIVVHMVAGLGEVSTHRDHRVSCSSVILGEIIAHKSSRLKSSRII
jgi:hypothetical protein